MEDLKQAYAVLGLPEDATREQVEQRYYLLLKKARSGKVNLEEINRAYNLIIGIESEKDAPQEKQGKISYFFYYYKYHVIISLIVLIVTGVTIKGCIDRKIEEANKPPLDLKVLVYGNFYSPENRDDQLSGNLLSLMQDWQRIDVDMAYIPKEITNPQDVALQQKGMVILATEKMDLMIIDEHYFDLLSRQGAFVPLDTLSIWPKLAQLDDRLVEAESEELPGLHPYGIDITDSPVFENTQTGMNQERKILVMRVEPPHPDKSEALIEQVAATLK